MGSNQGTLGHLRGIWRLPFLLRQEILLPALACHWKRGGLRRRTVEEMSIGPLVQWLQRPFANLMAVEEIPTGYLLPKHLR